MQKLEWSASAVIGRGTTSVQFLPSGRAIAVDLILRGVPVGQATSDFAETGQFPEHDHHVKFVAESVRTMLLPLTKAEGPWMMVSTLNAAWKRESDTVTYVVSGSYDKFVAFCIVVKNEGPADESGIREHQHPKARFFASPIEAMAACETWIPEDVDACDCAHAPVQV